MSKNKKQTGSSTSNIHKEEKGSTLEIFWKKYSEETPQKLKMIDAFILYLLTIIGVQFFYRIIVGNDFPKNAFLTGLFCPIGVIVLLLALRKSFA